MKLDHTAREGTARALADSLRVVYLEDDPALRDLLATRLREHPRIEDVTTYATPKDLLDNVSPADVDVAVLDLALGEGRTSGVEVGIALRGMRSDLPIVILTQHTVDNLADVLPVRHRAAWLFVKKSGSFDVDDLIRTLDATIRGASSVPATAPTRNPSALNQLTPRQREIMALASTGLDARAISVRLFLAHVTIRSELSRAYRVLVPHVGPGTDLRTAAVLEYLRLVATVDQAPPRSSAGV